MENLILEPLKFYEQAGKAHEQYANEYFDKLVDVSKINVEENRKTASAYRKQSSIAEGTFKKIRNYKVLRGFLIFFIVVGILASLIGIGALSGTVQVLTISIGIAVAISCLLIIFLKINKIIKSAAELYANQLKKAEDILRQAQAQMARLNSSFSEKDTLCLIEKVMPGIKFDDNYTVKLSHDFTKNFNYIDYINQNRSVVDTLSGRYNQNPFVFYRYVNHYIGSKIYHGTKIITWTERVRGSDGKYRTVTRSQTLHAQVSKPFPYYNYGTALAYGNQVAPDLNFSRQATDVEELSEKQVEKRVKKGQKKLSKLAAVSMENGGQFTEMANSEFDVLFGATDRDHEVQFRVMFSPMAQINMVKLLKADDVGYGDDFSFTKRGRFNCIISEHAQRWNMDTSPSNYYSYDVDIARKNFIEFNKQYFKSVFFDFAPLLSVPSYQEKPSSVFEPIEKYHSNYTYYDYEVLANAIGVQKFAHPNSVTEVILKARHMFSNNQTDCVQITANSYAGESRLDFIPVFGRDGRMHSVPVPWVEYIPLENVSNIAVKKVGLEIKDFNQRVAEKGVGNKLFDSPSAYLHGLFAKIIFGTDLSAIDSGLEKIKN